MKKSMVCKIMYVKPSHKMDAAAALNVVRTYDRMAMITTAHDGYIHATQVPLYYQDGKLIGHMARANAHWRAIDNGGEALVTLLGADAYIAPEGYANLNTDGHVVPTWNYERVDVRGSVRVFEGRERLLEAASIISDKFEQGRSEPWSVANAPPKFIQRMLKSIVGIEIQIESIIGKSKMDQDEPPENRKGVVDMLRRSGDVGNAKVADVMAGGL